MASTAAKLKFESPQAPEVLDAAPLELTTQRLTRLGEGIGKVVYASEHWVVKRQRAPHEVIALVLIWKFIRRTGWLLPAAVRERFLNRPSKLIRFMRVLVQPLVLLAPRSAWFFSHAGEMWRLYRKRDRRGERLAERHLAGSGLIPDRISFPPVRVAVGGWPGWITVDEACERVECTLHQRLSDLARQNRFDLVEKWLDRFLELRQRGWRRGLFSVDAHLKNFGVTEGRVVLLDAGGLTATWSEIEDHLTRASTNRAPHKALGLDSILQPRPDIARRFDDRWKETVTIDAVRSLWPASSVNSSAADF